MRNTFIIAELSANHGNNLSIALKTVRAAAKSGADAIKVQTYEADSLTLNIDNEFFGPKTSGPWKGKRPYDVFKEGALKKSFHRKIRDAALNCGMEFFSSPFDLESVDFLENIGVSRYKIASFEINHIPLISHVASKGKPVIISTGVAEEIDIENAIKTCHEKGNYDITLLKCTSEYPAKIEDANLAKMIDFKDRFGVKIGLSDHTEGDLCAVTAVALGAEVIEKHFILEKSIGGPDAFFSMEPEPFKLMVDKIRDVEKMIGITDYSLSEINRLRRRSIFVAENINQNEIITKNNIRIVRPGNGLEPKFFDQILGKRVKMNLKKGTPMKLEYIN